MSDLIDRKKAINVIERMRAYIGHNMERAVGVAFIEILDDVVEDIGRLPSIQFATDTNVGIKLGTNLAEVGTDCISRQTAINEANAWLLDCLKVNKQDRSCGLIRRLEDLPPAQPEIIRCKDCKHFNRDIPCVDGHYNGCDAWTDNGNEIMVAEDDFCSYAERRTDG